MRQNAAVADGLGHHRHDQLIAQALMIAFAMIVLDELGGGNAKKLKKLPKGCRLGGNAYAFIGGFRIWKNAWKGRSPGRGRSRRAE